MLKQVNLISAFNAGILGTVAMTIVMYGLPPLFGLPPMDIMAALGSVLPLRISPYLLGAAAHFGFRIVPAIIYAAFFYSWVPGPTWLRGALYSLLPWLFAITLLGPSLQLAGKVFGATSSSMANPCAVANPCAPANPCATKAPTNPCATAAANPCAVKPTNPCAVNPCAVKPSTNPCAVQKNPCAVQAANPCGAGPAASGGIPPQVLSLMVHLIYGGIIGAFYRPRT